MFAYFAAEFKYAEKGGRGQAKKATHKEGQIQRETRGETTCEDFGKRQSPINIECKKLLISTALRQNGGLKVSAPERSKFTLVIHEGGWRADFSDSHKIELTGPHLKNEYVLAQFHAHWAGSSDCGSEHLLDLKSFPAEVHFVFFATKYGDFDKAAEKPDGLAVLGVFLKEITASKDQIWQELGDAVAAALKNKTPKDCVLNLRKMLPETSSFCTYPGSLTTPPYLESVIWNICADAMNISAGQLELWRKIVSRNHRKIQLHNDRTVRASAKFSC
ncbi:unnamed protein product, partial [Mesorhabditis spiculigera]